jgi:hypothetical protein
MRNTDFYAWCPWNKNNKGEHAILVVEGAGSTPLPLPAKKATQREERLNARKA